MALSHNVLPFRKPITSDSATDNSFTPSRNLKVTSEDENQNKNVQYSAIKISTFDGPANSTFRTTAISIDELYPVAGDSSSLLAAALPLLSEAIRNLDDAIELIDSGDAIGADHAVQHSQSLLPELFCLRKLGDGYAAVISAVNNSISNKDGLPLTRDEIVSVKNALIEIRKTPFVGMDQAVDLTMTLEDIGLNVELAEIAHLTEAFSD